MATYRIDTADGRSFEITGDRAPTEQEINQMLGMQAQEEPSTTMRDIQGRILAFDSGYTGGWGKKTVGRLGGAIGGGIAGIVNAAQSGKLSDIGQGIAEGWDSQDELNRIKQEYAEAHPVENAVLQIGGGLANPLYRFGSGKAKQLAEVAGKYGTAAKLGARMAGEGATGAAFGLVRGTGNSQDVGDYLKSGEYVNDMALDAATNAAMPAIGPAVRPIARAAGKGIKGVTGFVSGTGTESIERAIDAGRRGSKSFLENMRGKVSPEATVGQAKQAFKDMASENSELYAANMEKAFADPTELSIDKITKKLGELKNKVTFNGKKPLRGEQKKLFDTIEDQLEPYLENSELRTTYGLDDLRQDIYAIKTEPGTKLNRFKKQMENVIKDTISEQRPEYRKGLTEYAKGKTELEEIAKTFGLGEGKSVDTALRKLQSTGRNNVQTNYGYRNQLLNKLDANGELQDAIAGQNFNALMPRGVTARGLGVANLALGNVVTLPAQSPRVVGELSYLVGRSSKGAQKAAEVLRRLRNINAAAFRPQKKK